MPTSDVAVPHSIRKDSWLFVELCEAVLRRGLPVRFTVHGQSMQPNLLDGDTVLVQPAAPGQLRLGDVALMQTAQGICVHRVSHISGSKISTRGDAGLENDPGPARIFGRVVSRCRDSREQSFSAWRTRVVHPLLRFSRRIRAAAAIRIRHATSLVMGALGLLSLLAAVFVSAASAQTPPIAQEQPAQAAPLGLVASAASAHLGNAPAAQGATVYSGDYLLTDNGGSLLVRVGAVSVELQGSSSAHIYRAPYGAVLELNSGSVVYSTLGSATQNIVIVASDVRATPVTNLADFGRVSIVDACNVTVQSLRGQVNVQVGSESHLVNAGKAYRVRAENSVSYRKYVSPEDADYHDYHEHKSCAAPWQTAKNSTPNFPARSNFLYLTVGVIIPFTIVPALEALESPSRP